MANATIITDVKTGGVVEDGAYAHFSITLGTGTDAADFVFATDPRATSKLLHVMLATSAAQAAALVKAKGGDEVVLALQQDITPTITGLGVRTANRRGQVESEVLLSLKLNHGATIHLTLSPALAAQMARKIDRTLQPPEDSSSN